MKTLTIVIGRCVKPDIYKTPNDFIFKNPLFSKL